MSRASSPQKSRASVTPGFGALLNIMSGPGFGDAWNRSRVDASWMKHTSPLPHGGGEAELVPSSGRGVNSRDAPDSGAVADRSRRLVRSGEFSPSSGEDSAGASLYDGGGDTAGSGGGNVAGDADGRTGRVERALGDASPTLAEWLQRGPYVLSMAPSFFGFYGHLGALMALEDAGLLDNVCLATGASAGAMVTGYFSAGVSAKDMSQRVLKLRRSDFWDPPGFGGLLRGRKYEDLLSGLLPEGVQDFEQCRVPLAVSAFDLLRFKTRVLSEGRLSTALRASSTFPILLMPVWHPCGVLVDGGIQDTLALVQEETYDVAVASHSDHTIWRYGHRNMVHSAEGASPESAERDDREGVQLVDVDTSFAAARSQVAAVLDERLRPGEEDAHWIAPTAGMAELGTRGEGARGKKPAAASAAVDPGEREPLIPAPDNHSRRALGGPGEGLRRRTNPSD